MQMHNPPHPGAILREYMGEKITVSALARHIGVPRENLSMIVNGRLGITAATAIKLADAFPNSDPEMWLGLQSQYDLAKVLRSKRKKKIEPIRETVAA